MALKSFTALNTLVAGLLGSACFFLSLATLASDRYLLADRYIDVLSGKTVTEAVVHIRDDRIIAAGSAGSIVIPDGAERIDLSGHTLLPGLMDMHVHITGRHDIQGFQRYLMTDGRAAINGVGNAHKTLMAGVTSIRNLGAPGYVDVDLRRAVERGEIPGPRMFVSGPSIGITGGHCDQNLLPQRYGARGDGVADGPWQVRQQVRENIKFGVDVIKICMTGGVMSQGTKVGAQQLTEEEALAIVDEAHRRGLIVAAHAHGTEGIKTAIRAGVDSVEHASFLDREAIKLAKKNGTVFSMDIYVTEHILSMGEAMGILPESLEKERTVGARQRESFRIAVKAGIKMVMGTDASIYPHGDNARQLSRMVEFGMKPMQALQAATINAAELLRQEDSLGSIDAGKYADIIAVAGDPLDNIALLEDVVFVMKGGKVFKGTSD